MKAGFIHLGDRLSLEVDSFLELLQDQYAEALSNGDLQGLAEVSGVLSITYTSVGAHELSTRWARQYLDHVRAFSDSA